MEWVVALLALGCLLFILHMLSDYFKRRQELEPKIQRLDQAKGKLQREIEGAQRGLEEERDRLSPLRQEVSQLEEEARQLQQQPLPRKPRPSGGAQKTEPS